MKKRLTALLLTSALVLSLAACGGGSSNTPASTAPEGSAPAETENSVNFTACHRVLLLWDMVIRSFFPQK